MLLSWNKALTQSVFEKWFSLRYIELMSNEAIRFNFFKSTGQSSLWIDIYHIDENLMVCILQVQHLVEQISDHWTEYWKAFKILVVWNGGLIDNVLPENIQLFHNEFYLLSICLLKYHSPVLKRALLRDFVLLLQVLSHYLSQLFESLILEIGALLQEVEENQRTLVSTSLWMKRLQFLNR